MKFTKLIFIFITLAIYSNSSLANLSNHEYKKMVSKTQCAFITNLMKPGVLPQKTIDKAFNNAIETFKKSNALLQGYPYNPTNKELARDFAIHYQQSTSDLYDEMFISLQNQGLSLTPQSWFLIANQYWDLKNCFLVIEK
ncbi:hypothetical protein ACPAVH_23885 [Enterobacteriaceae bacterium TYF_5]